MSPKALDFGFGSGRHIKYLVDNGFFGYGIDISNQAKKLANKFLNLNKIKKKNFKLIINKKDNIINIPSNHIDICISHGTLDSMTLNNAKIVSNEIYKVLKKGSFFYCDLISTEVARVGKKFRGSENQIIVNEDHEKGTIQSFFNVKSIKELFHQFKIIEIYKKNLPKKPYSRFKISYNTSKMIPLSLVRNSFDKCKSLFQSNIKSHNFDINLILIGENFYLTH